MKTFTSMIRLLRYIALLCLGDISNNGAFPSMLYKSVGSEERLVNSIFYSLLDPLHMLTRHVHTPTLKLQISCADML